MSRAVSGITISTMRCRRRLLRSDKHCRARDHPCTHPTTPGDLKPQPQHPIPTTQVNDIAMVVPRNSTIEANQSGLIAEPLIDITPGVRAGLLKVIMIRLSERLFPVTAALKQRGVPRLCLHSRVGSTHRPHFRVGPFLYRTF